MPHQHDDEQDDQRHHSEGRTGDEQHEKDFGHAEPYALSPRGVLEASRDWYDNDGAPWRAEMFISVSIVVLMVSVAALTALFLGIKTLVGG